MAEETEYTHDRDADALQHVLNLHREGKHSGRRSDPDCPHCTDDARTVLARHALPVPGMKGLLQVVLPDNSLSRWWMEQSRRELEKISPQINSYGAYDLEMMGSFLRDLVGEERLHEASNSELACGVYLLGKISRAMSAYREGRQPSEDTIMDIVVYARMILRIRTVGGWPGMEPTEEW